MMKRRTILSSLAAAGLLGTAAACSPSSDDGGDSAGGASDAGGSTGGDKGTLTFRLWDQNAVPAYEESFQAFTAESGWNVNIDVVPWGDYWTRLPLDVASGDAADVYWMNSANYVQFKDSEALLDINEIIPDGASQICGTPQSPPSRVYRSTTACSHWEAPSGMTSLMSSSASESLNCT